MQKELNDKVEKEKEQNIKHKKEKNEIISRLNGESIDLVKQLKLKHNIESSEKTKRYAEILQQREKEETTKTEIIKEKLNEAFCYIH